MSKSLATPSQTMALNLEKVLIEGDLAPLNVEQRLDYVNRVSKAIGINPLMRPFDFIKFNGKIIMYANRACAEQLRMKYGVSIKITDRKKESDLYIVTAQAITAKGKTDESIGAISIRGLTGLELANALMKCETKAKRRVTLSISGLGILDETEVRDKIEREIIEQDKGTADSVAAKIEGTTERPEFEKAEPKPIHEQEAQQLDGATYILKSGKHKGKKITALNKKQVEVWLNTYNKMVKSGSRINSEVEQDTQEILKFINDPEFSWEANDKQD